MHKPKVKIMLAMTLEDINVQYDIYPKHRKKGKTISLILRHVV